jgi:hypothetical protein
MTILDAKKHKKRRESWTTCNDLCDKSNCRDNLSAYLHVQYFVPVQTKSVTFNFKVNQEHLWQSAEKRRARRMNSTTVDNVSKKRNRKPALHAYTVWPYARLVLKGQLCSESTTNQTAVCLKQIRNYGDCKRTTMVELYFKLAIPLPPVSSGIVMDKCSVHTCGNNVWVLLKQRMLFATWKMLCYGIFWRKLVLPFRARYGTVDVQETRSSSQSSNISFYATLHDTD